MKKNNGILILLLLISGSIYGQVRENKHIVEINRKGKFSVGLAFDVIKTDFESRLGNKIQSGLEINYFLVHRFSVTGGMEAWVDSVATYSGVAGVRYYPVKNFFVRARGIVGVNEISAGVGFSIFLNEQWTAEGMLDAYTSKDVAARVGISYLLLGREKNAQQ